MDDYDVQDSNATTLLDPPGVSDTSSADGAEDRVLSILDVDITDVRRHRATELIEAMIRQYDGRSRSVFFVNAHTLNLAASDATFRDVLNSADYVFGDGTGVRWAARLQDVRLKDNLVGTDLMPKLFQTTAGRGYRYFMLGADRATVGNAARFAAIHFDGWTQAGFHHGYLDDPALNARTIRQINEAAPHVLLVGMGNPRQEQWIQRNRHRLKVPVCMGVGGLFHYWAGDLRRAPLWLRRYGSEWLGILLQQPHKARRYLLGNPLFLMRIALEHCKRVGRSRR